MTATLSPGNRVVLNSSMNWNEVSIYTTPNSYPKSAMPEIEHLTQLLVRCADRETRGASTTAAAATARSTNLEKVLPNYLPDERIARRMIRRSDRQWLMGAIAFSGQRPLDIILVKIDAMQQPACRDGKD